MNQKQKTLAEKTIKIKFNGTIASLRAATTEVERDNPALPTLPTPHCNCDDSFSLEGDGCGYPYSNRNRTTMLDDSQQWPQAVKDAAVALNTALKEANLQYDLLKASITEANEMTREENRLRQDKVNGAAKARFVLCDQLAAERDDRILDVAFQGEDSEMLDFLKSLPTPNAIADRLKLVGMSLTKALPTVTGIGEKMPKHLNQSSVTVNVGVQEDA